MQKIDRERSRDQKEKNHSKKGKYNAPSRSSSRSIISKSCEYYIFYLKEPIPQKEEIKIMLNYIEEDFPTLIFKSIFDWPLRDLKKRVNEGKLDNDSLKIFGTYLKENPKFNEDQIFTLTNSSTYYSIDPEKIRQIRYDLHQKGELDPLTITSIAHNYESNVQYYLKKKGLIEFPSYLILKESCFFQELDGIFKNNKSQIVFNDAPFFEIYPNNDKTTKTTFNAGSTLVLEIKSSFPGIGKNKKKLDDELNNFFKKVEKTFKLFLKEKFKEKDLKLIFLFNHYEYNQASEEIRDFFRNDENNDFRKYQENFFVYYFSNDLLVTRQNKKLESQNKKLDSQNKELEKKVSKLQKVESQNKELENQVLKAEMMGMVKAFKAVNMSTKNIELQLKKAGFELSVEDIEKI